MKNQSLKFQELSSDLFALEALQPEQARKIVGGKIIGGAGGYEANNGPSGTTRHTWSSDSDDGSKQNIAHSGADAGLFNVVYGGGTSTFLDLANDSRSNVIPFPSTGGGVVIVNVNTCGNSKNTLNSSFD